MALFAGILAGGPRFVIVGMLHLRQIAMLVCESSKLCNYMIGLWSEARAVSRKDVSKVMRCSTSVSCADSEILAMHRMVKFILLPSVAQ